MPDVVERWTSTVADTDARQRARPGCREDSRLDMRETVIVSAVRTPTGKFLGGLKDFRAPDLGALAVREAVRRAGIDPSAVDECIMGNVVSAGLGQAPARQAALKGGLANGVGALTINKVCGSGLKAVMLAAQGIAHRRHRHRGRRRHGVDEQLPVSAAARARRPAHGRRQDRRLDDPRRPVGFVPQHPHGPDRRARRPRRTTSRARSRTATPSRAIARPPTATRDGWFKDEILPVSIPQKKGDPIVVRSRRVDSRRHDAPNRSARLKPAFKKDGTVTAGNAPGVNDGAAALVVMGADVADAPQASRRSRASSATRRPGSSRSS